MARDSQFSRYRISNAHILFDGESKAQKMGCTGELEVSSSIKVVKKFCEGIEKESRRKVVGMKIKLKGHWERAALDKILGLDTTNLKPGVYSYGVNSFTKPVTLTFDAYDLFETDKELLAFPICSPVDGLEIKVKNGEETVSEVEIEFNCGADENGKFMYSAFESEAVSVKADWHTKFDFKKMVQGA